MLADLSGSTKVIRLDFNYTDATKIPDAYLDGYIKGIL